MIFIKLLLTIYHPQPPIPLLRTHPLPFVNTTFTHRSFHFLHDHPSLIFHPHHLHRRHHSSRSTAESMQRCIHICNYYCSSRFIGLESGLSDTVLRESGTWTLDQAARLNSKQEQLELQRLPDFLHAHRLFPCFSRRILLHFMHTKRKFGLFFKLLLLQHIVIEWF